MPVRGRGRQLDDAAAVLDAARGSGQAGALIVRGAAGAGKSRLIQAVSELAAGRGFQVLHGSGDPDAMTMPMATLLQAVLGGTPPLLDRASVQATLRNDDARYVLVEEIIEALENAARQRPLMVTLDDIQFSDPTTLFAVRVASERLISESVVWVVASREPIRDDAVARTIGQLENLNAATLLATPIEVEDAYLIAEDLLEAALDDNLRDIVARSEGQVVDLVETLRGLLDEGRINIVDGSATVRGTSVPIRLRDSVDRRLARLPQSGVDILGAAAVLGRHFDPSVLAASTGTSSADVFSALQAAEQAQLLVKVDARYGFRHDLIREAVEMTLRPDQRRDLRRAAVSAQLDAGVPVLEVAGALATTAQPGDLEAAVLLEQASREIAAVDPSTAADLLGRAAAVAVDDPQRHGQLSAQRVSLLWQAGRVAEAQQIGEHALMVGLAPAQEAQVRLGLAQVASEHSYREAQRHTTAAIALPGVDDGLRAKLFAAHCVTKIVVNDSADLDETLATALDLAVRTRDRLAEASILATTSTRALHLLDWDRAFVLAEEGSRVAQQTDDETTMWSPKTLWLAIFWSTAGSPEEALRLADQGIAAATTARQGAAMSLWMMIRSRVLLEAGQLTDAQAEAEAVLALTDWRERSTMADYTVNFVLRRVAQYTGEPDALRRTQSVPAAMSRDDVSTVRRQGKWLAAIDADADGHPDLAIELTAEGVGAFGRPGNAFSLDPADEAVFARIASRAGRSDLAERAAQFTERRAAANPRYPLLTAIARHTRGLVDDAPDVLADAAELFADTHRPLPRAAALEDAGRVNPDRDSAVHQLDQAHSIYAKAGALRDAARTRQRLRGLGVRRQQPREASADKLASLTPAELGVVELVARGATNREVAAQLFLSPHTVSTHLRHAFTKIGVRSRTELAHVTTLSQLAGD